MNHYIVHEPEIRTRFVNNALRILIQNKRRRAMGLSEAQWAGRVPRVLYDEGCGPEILSKALGTSKRLGSQKIESNISRNGDPDFYVRLFAWLDEATQTMRYPPRQHAVDILTAINNPNPQFESLWKEYLKLDCGTRFKDKEEGAVVWIPRRAKLRILG